MSLAVALCLQTLMVLLTVGGGGPSFSGWWVGTMDFPSMQSNKFLVTSGTSSLQTWTEPLQYENVKDYC